NLGGPTQGQRVPSAWDTAPGAMGHAADDAGPGRLLESPVPPGDAETTPPARPDASQQFWSLTMPQKRTLPRRPLIWAALALLAGLLPLLLGITDVRAQQQEPPAQPAQDQTKIYLPALALPGKPAPEGSPVIESFQISSAS